MIPLIKKLYGMRRDIISDGYDEALAYVSKKIPFTIHEIPTGTKCWTWIVPPKWSVGDAYIEDMNGKRLLDLKNHPLHVVSYSLPINRTVTKKELMKHLHTNPDRPNAIPFEFKYYERDWGFCIQHNKLKNFTSSRYKVRIDSKSEKGTLKVGEYTIKGKADECIVIVAHLDHPGLVNDDLSGVAVLMELAKHMCRQKTKPHYTYTFLLVPETIGSIAYLSQNEHLIGKMKYGIFLEMLGNNHAHSLQHSRQGDTEVDRIAQYVMDRTLKEYSEGTFRKVVGNDEMVFNGPGVNIPMISVSRAAHGIPHYPEYHTSDDNMRVVSEAHLKESSALVREMLDILDANYIPQRTFKGPVFLSRYRLWVDWRVNRPLNHAVEQMMLRLEGDHSVFDIAQELDLDFWDVKDYLDKFVVKRLIKKLPC